MLHHGRGVTAKTRKANASEQHLQLSPAIDQSIDILNTLIEQSPEYYGKILKRAADLKKLENGNLLEGLQ